MTRSEHSAELQRRRASHIYRLALVGSVLLASLCCTATARAQWANVAPNRMVVATQGVSGGAMTYAAGQIWASDAFDLWMSPDDGVTWSRIAINLDLSTIVYDIDFLDRTNGVVTSFREGLFITHDGGKNWIKATIGNAFYLSAKFVGSASTIVAACSNGAVYLSVDSGNSWKNISPGPTFGNVMELRTDRLTGTIYGSFLKRNIQSHLLWTTDLGSTWTSSAGTYNYDSYSFALDPCNDKLIYIANEGTYSSEPDLKGRMLYSHDRGATFAAVDVQLSTYFAGSVICSKGGIAYAQTQRSSEGVVRSTDKGLSWSSIGGPPGLVDSRLLCAKDDNTIFAIATDGSVWRTNNSGGSPVAPAPPSGSLTFAQNTLFDGDTTNECDSPLVRILRPTYSGCNPPDIAAANIVGPFAASYRLQIVGHDSLTIELLSGQSGALGASLLITLSDSTKITIALNGYGEHAPFTCTATSDPVADTVGLCDSSMRTIVLHVSGCSVPAIASETVSGADASDFVVRRHPANPPHAADSVVLVFKPTKTGARSAVYTLRLVDGTTITLPLSGFGDGELYRFTSTPASLADSLTLCDSAITRTIAVSLRGCVVPFVMSQGIVGPAASDYSLDKRIGYAPGDGDSAVITFHPSSAGARSAQYVIVLTDSTVITLPLDGFGRSVPFSASVVPASAADTVTDCDAVLTHTFLISATGCPEAKIVSQTIDGVDAEEYVLLRAAPDSVAGADSAIVRFMPTASGSTHARYTVRFADGTVLVVPLEDVSYVTPFVCTVAPVSAFGADSLYECDSPVEMLVLLTVKGCPVSKILSQRIVGAAAGDYAIMRAAADSIAGTDSVRLSFHPSASGLRDATFILAFENGDTIRIPLAGDGRSPLTLTFAASDDSTDVIGATLHVPISVSGLTTHTAAQIVLHYDTNGNLEYNGSFDPGNPRIDMPGESWPGRSKLQLQGPIDATGLPYASFTVYADTSSKNYYRFDSLSVADASDPCAFVVATSSAEAALFIAPQGCSSQILSQFVHHRMMPQFRIVPNPASDRIAIVSSSTVEADIAIVDALGTVVRRLRRTIGPDGCPEPADIGSLPNGALLVRITTASGTVSLPLMVIR